MGERFDRLHDKHRAFIARQHLFFAASATADSRINLSPRSTDLFRVVSECRVLYLDRTGSGNETAAHLLADGRLTIMFCAFSGPPRILRLYGRGSLVQRWSETFDAIVRDCFADDLPAGARQVVQLNIDLVKESCGFGVPRFDYAGEREALERWAEDKGPAGIEAYWRERNRTSLDGDPTGIFPEE
ncbi:MAG: pyridoxamine 5'-phosphate oxidase family protein [Pseudomonadota bacterium]